MEHEAATHMPSWFKDVVMNKANATFSAGGELNGQHEKILGCRTYLAGPTNTKRKPEKASLLSRGRLTGLAAPIAMFVPQQVMSSLAGTCAAYGADITNNTTGSCHLPSNLLL